MASKMAAKKEKKTFFVNEIRIQSFDNANCLNCIDVCISEFYVFLKPS